MMELYEFHPGLARREPRGHTEPMRYALLLAIVASIAPSTHARRNAPEGPICYYSNRGAEVRSRTARCLDTNNAKFSEGDVFEFTCGVRNAHNIFSSLCDDPCAAAMKGLNNYRLHGKTVLYGPPNIPTGKVRFSFGLFNGSCDQVDRIVRQGGRPEFDPLLDDHIIKAAELEPPTRR